MAEDKLRILLVDDHDVVRVGLRALLESQPGFQVVGEAGSAAEAIAEAARSDPDVIVMDVRLPDGSGVEACRAIRARQPDVRVLMLTSYADDEAVFAAILAGAAGYILKQIRGKALVEAIATVGAGGSLLDPSVTQRVLERLRAIGPASPGPGSLTEQEQRILSLVAEGKTNREIADALFLSEGTVKNYVSSILGKLNFSRRSQLAAYVARSRGVASERWG